MATFSIIFRDTNESVRMYGMWKSAFETCGIALDQQFKADPYGREKCMTVLGLDHTRNLLVSSYMGTEGNCFIVLIGNGNDLQYKRAMVFEVEDDMKEIIRC
jgi:hypothetical protein